jgi:hypothetical protein
VIRKRSPGYIAFDAYHPLAGKLPIIATLDTANGSQRRAAAVAGGDVSWNKEKLGSTNLQVGVDCHAAPAWTPT